MQCFIAQLEYYKTVLYAGGSNPARKISLISTAVLFGAACLVPVRRDAARHAATVAASVAAVERPPPTETRRAL